MRLLTELLGRAMGVPDLQRQIQELQLRVIEAEQLADDLAAKQQPPTITVCSECLRACCWQGEFMCDEAYGSAGTVEKTMAELQEINRDHPREHPSYWDINPRTGCAYRCDSSYDRSHPCRD